MVSWRIRRLSASKIGSLIMAHGTDEAHIGSMTEKPKFRAEMNRSGRWFVAITTGYGPDSHVGDFETEEEAQRWISTRSKDWPHPVNKTE
jgi:hypothetical protein